jgi:rSAM/selenodomain-associated transferase 1
LKNWKNDRVEARLIVIAKSPVPGRSKTRLCPPCSPEQAAELAEGALADTLESVAATSCAGRVLVLEGDPGDWLPSGFEVRSQAGGGLGERLDAAFLASPGPALLVGMDTPQISPELLTRSMSCLADEDVDAVIGLCPDGGYWAIGFREYLPGAFDGVPMSTSETGSAQITRLRDLGLRVMELEMLADVDFFEDAAAVAALRPEGRFAAILKSMEPARA